MAQTHRSTVSLKVYLPEATFKLLAQARKHRSLTVNDLAITLLESSLGKEPHYPAHFIRSSTQERRTTWVVPAHLHATLKQRTKQYSEHYGYGISLSDVIRHLVDEYLQTLGEL